jgi:hypothetical protein
MTVNSECNGFYPSEYFHALIEFERDPLPPPRPASALDAVSGDQQRSTTRAAGAARPSKFRLYPAGEGRVRGLIYHGDAFVTGACLSQLEPLELV